MDFSNSLIKWYLQNKRDLPWRNTTNPYKIWLSEIILQQTRVAQGLPFYIKFVNAFPTVFDLATASEESVLKLWQGLGYYSRARNLHTTAKYIAGDCNGVFPTSYAELRKLTGVGDYTAAAVASFSYDEVVPVVDGNVYRVLSRYFNIDTNITDSNAKKEFFSLANELISKKDPALFNQAIMEFGALQCVPKNPNCMNCIFNISCSGLQHKKVALLPVKLKKIKISKRFFNYIIFEDQDQKTIISIRNQKGIWQNLYEFPLIETSIEVATDFILDTLTTNQIVGNKIESVQENFEKSILHKLSHQHLYIKFWRVSVSDKLESGIDYDTLLKYPFPIVIFNFIENHW